MSVPTLLALAVVLLLLNAFFVGAEFAVITARRSQVEPLADAGRPIAPPERVPSAFYVRLSVIDRPGVLARVAESFARHEVSIKAVRQEGRGDDAQLVIVTHSAPDAALASCVDDLGAMDVVRAVASVMRVEGEGEE